MDNSKITQTIEHIFREQSGRVLANLIGTLRDFELAEDVMQEAFISAFEVWPEKGIPNKPAAWLTTTAKRKAIDRLRRMKNFEQKSETIKLIIEEDHQYSAEPDMDEIPDERLKLIFTCCHPAIALDAQIALTLRTLGGLEADEIAAAFLVPRTTMQQRIVRAKRKIKKAGIPYRVPPAHLLDERLDAVLTVVYLIFNAGYTAAKGDALIKHELCDEAIRLGRVLAMLMPDNAEVLGLIALMMLHHARRDARSDGDGTLILLEDQNRALWDETAIEYGSAILDKALEMGSPGPYQIQAAIAALHDGVDSAEKTDWQQIALLYKSLMRHSTNPVVALNHAVAVAMAEDPMRGLALLDELGKDGRLDQYHLYHAARADLLRRAGQPEKAQAAYENALALASNEQEQAFLRRRLTELT